MNANIIYHTTLKANSHSHITCPYHTRWVSCQYKLFAFLFVCFFNTLYQFFLGGGRGGK